MQSHCVEHLLELSQRACVSILSINISTFVDHWTYSCFVCWCMHLYLHNLVHALIYETTKPITKMVCFVNKCMHLNRVNRVSVCSYQRRVQLNLLVSLSYKCLMNNAFKKVHTKEHQFIPLINSELPIKYLHVFTIETP